MLVKATEHRAPGQAQRVVLNTEAVGIFYGHRSNGRTDNVRIRYCRAVVAASVAAVLLLCRLLWTTKFGRWLTADG